MFVWDNGTRKEKSVSVVTTEVENVPHIIVDPGHGGEDGGTASSKGVLEKAVNLEISNKLSKLLNLVGYRVIMTRTDDKLIYDSTSETMRQKKVSDIRNRMKIIENNPDSVFLSIHQNYYTESTYWGTQVFYSGNNTESKIVADEIQKSVAQNLQKDNTRKIKQSGEEIYLLYHAKSPAVMVECGFMSNPSEALLLCDEAYQTKMAIAIINGVNSYIKNKGEK